MDGPARDVAVLLTGVGKRYDIVSAFAQQHGDPTGTRSAPWEAGVSSVRPAAWVG